MDRKPCASVARGPIGSRGHAPSAGKIGALRRGLAPVKSTRSYRERAADERILLERPAHLSHGDQVVEAATFAGTAIASGAFSLASSSLTSRARAVIQKRPRTLRDRLAATSLARERIEAELGVLLFGQPVSQEQKGHREWFIVFELGGFDYMALIELGRRDSKPKSVKLGKARMPRR